uniref:C2H2-type domain-containing protein n=1 Tax=viral metagenome TaxID=1070528 RepID=A0A6C0ESW0_9ZZZZ
MLCEDCGKYFCKEHNGRMHGEKVCEDTIKGCHGTLK